MDEVDPHTLRVVAGLVRSQMSNLHMDTKLDGLQRVGVHRTLKQLAIDLEVSADHFTKPSRTKRNSVRR
ncbi:MAG: hypothetical protein KGL48_12240 [Sphingomonadales bacterium]|nr:hypothetical protein [Sphingomonadales bacterium]MDE2569621.1 hypothetical protein [Sphingomonadales bacterium]